jgi:uncharacterized protein (DUF3084 family)
MLVVIKQVTTETHELHVSLDEKQRKLTEYQTNIAKIEKYASDLQTFIAVKQMEKDVETHDTCLQSLVNSNSLTQAKLTCILFYFGYICLVFGQFSLFLV